MTFSKAKTAEGRAVSEIGPHSGARRPNPHQRLAQARQSTRLQGWDSLIAAGWLAGKRTVQSAYWAMSKSSGYRSCKCGAVYDRSEHMVEEREISSFECAVCGETIENWNSAWVPRYRFIACPARTPND